MHGAPSLLRYCLSVFVLLAQPFAATAEEFGNLIAPSVDDRSRDASAQALGAVSLIVKGLQNREKRDRGGEKDSLSLATSELIKASDKMSAFFKEIDTNPELRRLLRTDFDYRKDVPEKDWYLLQIWANRFGRDMKDIKTKDEVFGLFVADTRRLAILVSELAGNPDRTVVRRIVDDLTLYLTMGVVSAEIFRQKR